MNTIGEGGGDKKKKTSFKLKEKAQPPHPHPCVISDWSWKPTIWTVAWDCQLIETMRMMLLSESQQRLLIRLPELYISCLIENSPIPAFET